MNMGAIGPLVQCPQCGIKFQYYTSEYRPFCSERCRLVDLGHWLSDSYRIAGRPDPKNPDLNTESDEDDGEFQDPEENDDEDEEES